MPSSESEGDDSSESEGEDSSESEGEELEEDADESSSCSSISSQENDSSMTEVDGLRSDSSKRHGLVCLFLRRPPVSPLPSKPSSLSPSGCWLQAPADRAPLWIKAQKFCDTYYPPRKAFKAMPLTRNRVDGKEVPYCFSEREWLIARMVLGCNRDEGQEYVEKLKDEEFCYQSRKEVRGCVCGCVCTAVCLVSFFALLGLFTRAVGKIFSLICLPCMHAASGDL